MIKKIKSFRDIITHSDLAKARSKLIKKNNNSNGNGNGAKEGFSLRDKMIFLKILHRLESDVRELEGFKKEGISGAAAELREKEERLSRFQKYYFHRL